MCRDRGRLLCREDADLPSAAKPITVYLEPDTADAPRARTFGEFVVECQGIIWVFVRRVVVSSLVPHRPCPCLDVSIVVAFFALLPGTVAHGSSGSRVR